VSDPAALAPPSGDVRREILRLELESFGIQVPAEEAAGATAEEAAGATAGPDARDPGADTHTDATPADEPNAA
jgi:hypothetical protein